MDGFLRMPSFSRALRFSRRTRRPPSVRVSDSLRVFGGFRLRSGIGEVGREVWRASWRGRRDARALGQVSRCFASCSCPSDSCSALKRGRGGHAVSAFGQGLLLPKYAPRFRRVERSGRTRVASAGSHPRRANVRALHKREARVCAPRPRSVAAKGTFFRQALSLCQQRKCGKTAKPCRPPREVAIRHERGAGSGSRAGRPVIFAPYKQNGRIL